MAVRRMSVRRGAASKVAPTTKREKTEHEEQREFVKWWRQNRPELIFAIPNGGVRGKAAGGRLKAEGVTAGVWDLFVPELRLWIEMKREKRGTVSAEQVKFGREMIRLGYRTMVAWGCRDAINQTINGERASWKRPTTR